MLRRIAAIFPVIGVWVGCTASSSETTPTIADAGNTPAPDAAMGNDAASPVNDASAPSTDGAPADPPPSPECAAYCTGILQTCTSAGVAQYPSLAACHYTCRLFPPGMEGDWKDYPDTFACRRLHLAAAAPPSEHDHCHHSGPFGYGGCGGVCTSFCRVAFDRCKGATPFASPQACLSECEGWPYAPPDPEYGIASYQATKPTTGDSHECRQVMLMKALESITGRDTYCPTLGTNSSICK